MADTEIVIPIRYDLEAEQAQWDSYRAKATAQAEAVAENLGQVGSVASATAVDLSKLKAAMAAGEIGQGFKDLPSFMAALANQSKDAQADFQRWIATTQQASAAIAPTTQAVKEQTASVAAAGQTWREFVKDRMGPYMKELGSHGAAIRKIGEEWRALKESGGAAAAATTQFTGATALGAQTSVLAAGAHGQHTAAMFEWKKEAGRTREAAQFLTASFGTLASQSPPLAAGFRLAATALLGGGGLILALEAVRAVVDLGMSAWDSHKQKLEEAKKATEDHARALAEIKGHLSDYLAALRGVPPVYVELQRQMRAFDQEAAPHVKQLEELRKKLAEYQKQAAAGQQMDDLAAAHAAASAEEIAQIQAKIDKIEEKRRAARNAADIERAASQEWATRQSALDSRANAIIGRGIEETRQFNAATLALSQKFSADEVRIRGDAKRQIADVTSNTGIRTEQETNARIIAINKAADEEILRAREARWLASFQAMQAPKAVGATAEDQAYLELGNKLAAMSNELAQADRAHDVEKMKSIRDRMRAESEATDLKVTLLDAEAAKQRALASQAFDAERQEAAERQAMERADRYEIAKNLADARGDTAAAKRLADLEKELDAERIMLEEVAQEQPQLAGQVELALTKLKQKGAKDRAAIVANAHSEELAAASAFFTTMAGLQSSNIKGLAAVGKAAAIAQATIDTYVAMNKALGQGGITGPVMAAAVGAIGFANVARIASTFRRGGYTGDGPEDEEAGTVHRQEVVMSAPAVRRIGRDRLEAMNRGDASAPSAAPFNLEINSYAPVDIEPTWDEGRLIVLIRKHSPRAVADDMRSNPNGHVASAITRTTTARRKL